jgi:SAM-dependent MidA family methyltransferase
VRWARDVHEFGEDEVNGIIFSNEFLDALPVHRLAWDAANRRWQEWQVTGGAHGLAWHLGMPAVALLLPAVAPELAGLVPEGFVAEVSPVAVDWWRAAARRLRRGRLLAIDYGFSAEGGLRPDRPRGSLRAFVRHHPSEDLLANPGEQDLTADVNFTAMEEAGRAEGLGVGVLARQSKFLTQILARTQVKPEGFGEWTEKSSRQFQTLTHPEHLGRSFYWLIQAKGLLPLDLEVRSSQLAAENVPPSAELRTTV